MKKQNREEEMIVYGTVKVSDKGQIALPVELRKDLDIARGDQLLIVRKKNSGTFAFMTMKEVMKSIQDLWVDDFVPEEFRSK
ncbi:MAG TPA: AbrB/MazE/SpoVT family DNA-binding domain-containing protein [Spirochaetota bacterium]|nr:AbrB/MazE/SpoVT family DNA-binding domain-containing protein [Spirochaetota bacterium]HNT11327.1 AbrB/MazE/SpoVT family DNA-binding domain-containing protein [Spirochaetota bacterium]HNV45821.1 AbrB/MazE/SpoVT family DNA-binding domain-containing protein [Spirochaetota bacterium]HOS38428.1 AbrB/MazE/SpoVT family DNA-binding domain-containing protein [Spirochaetota bacterium]HPI23026.1 AbrB/MazE/SpoVT family DNA-binding domain-containing protein [Spirochaetota bacterium]